MLGEMWSAGRDMSRYVGGPPAPSQPPHLWHWPTEPTPSPYHIAPHPSVGPTEQRNEIGGEVNRIHFAYSLDMWCDRPEGNRLSSGTHSTIHQWTDKNGIWRGQISSPCRILEYGRGRLQLCGQFHCGQGPRSGQVCLGEMSGVLFLFGNFRCVQHH